MSGRSEEDGDRPATGRTGSADGRGRDTKNAEAGGRSGSAASSGPERTADGHHVVVGGRKWRASDPGIPDALRDELVQELMSARRAVKSSEEHARDRVQDAKVALGERGEPWWEQPTEAGARARQEATVRALLRHRAGSTICPSDVARAVGGDTWRELMPQVRDVARAMADVGEITIRQKGEKVDIATARGPVRLAPGPELAGPDPRGR